jgi:hypothetical protein
MPVVAGSGQIRLGAVAAVLGCAALLAAGCGGDRPSTPVKESASRTVTRESTSRTVTSSGSTSGSARRALAARYLVIANAGNRRLDGDFDPLEHRDRNNLPHGKADLRDAAAAERLFDRRLLAIEFPAQTERVAHDLYQVNQARARLTGTAAASTSLHQLHAYQKRLDAANRPVEQAVRALRRQLGLPPPPTS